MIDIVGTSANKWTYSRYQDQDAAQIIRIALYSYTVKEIKSNYFFKSLCFIAMQQSIRTVLLCSLSLGAT